MEIDLVDKIHTRICFYQGDGYGDSLFSLYLLQEMKGFIDDDRHDFVELMIFY